MFTTLHTLANTASSKNKLSPLLPMSNITEPGSPFSDMDISSSSDEKTLPSLLFKIDLEDKEEEDQLTGEPILPNISNLFNITPHPNRGLWDKNRAEAMCYDPGPQFSFSGPLIPFPRHSLPSNPLLITCHQVTPSQEVPCILLDCHVTLKAHWLLHSLLFYVTNPLQEGTIKPLFASIGNSIVLSLLFSILSSDITTVHSILSSDLLLCVCHYCRSPIILLFSQLGVGTSYLYIRATISLELGLKPNLVFNPRLVASPVSLLRVPLALELLQSPL